MNPAPKVDFDRVVWRVDSKPFQREGSRTGWRARFVPYLTAPIAASLLDEWVGPGSWRDSYEPGPSTGTLYCHLSILDPDTGEWISKTDIGVSPSGDQEMAIKGLVSDAFKRAAILKWGVGRNVYELPTLWAACREHNEKAYWDDDHTKADLERQLKQLGIDVEPREHAGGE